MSESRMIPQEEQAQVLSPRARWHPIGQHFQHCNTVQNLPDTAGTLRTPRTVWNLPGPSGNLKGFKYLRAFQNTSELTCVRFSTLFDLSELPERRNHPNSAKCSGETRATWLNKNLRNTATPRSLAQAFQFPSGTFKLYSGTVIPEKFCKCFTAITQNKDGRCNPQKPANLVALAWSMTSMSTSNPFPMAKH